MESNNIPNESVLPTEHKSQKQDDISRKTIVVLLVLVTVLSVLGTWSVFSEINKFNEAQDVEMSGSNVAQGTVKFTILKPTAPPRTVATGKVMLEIRKPED